MTNEQINTHINDLIGIYNEIQASSDFNFREELETHLADRLGDLELEYAFRNFELSVEQAVEMRKIINLVERKNADRYTIYR
jgi:hypothetical protein